MWVFHEDVRAIISLVVLTIGTEVVDLVQLESKFTFDIIVYTYYHISTYSFRKISLYLLREDSV